MTTQGGDGESNDDTLHAVLRPSQGLKCSLHPVFLAKAHPSHSCIVVIRDSFDIGMTLRSVATAGSSEGNVGCGHRRLRTSWMVSILRFRYIDIGGDEET
jgi:hypothetical protein